MRERKGRPGPVAVIGLGAMGLPMALALLRGGFVVRGYDLRADARAAFAADGGIVVDSVRTAAAGAA
ncbi:MAG: NAD(P)-binding domain-containing protein, partial [Rhodospirillales bacterium]|nr:NAD(P)-binding domain-containing protein [Rhodospirillales bacterium]